MPKTALVVKTDFSVETIDLTENELSKLQTAVGGLIQPVDLGPEVTLWVNEEGLLIDGMEPNYLATAITTEMGYRNAMMGDVVFTGGSDEDGNTMSLPELAEQELRNMAAYLAGVLN